MTNTVAELLRLKVDLIVTRGEPANLAAKNAATTIPIVMIVSADPVGEGLVISLARPGGNVTGNSGLVPELNTKRLEILKDAVPKLTRIGILHGPGDYIAGALQLKELRAVALGVPSAVLAAHLRCGDQRRGAKNPVLAKLA